MATGTVNYGFRKPATTDNVIVLTDISDNMDDIDTELKRVDDVAAAVAGGTWSTYTPTWASTGTQPALGNGTLTGRWAKTGKIVHIKIRLVMGTTTTYGTGDWTLSLPSSLPSATHANLATVGQCVAFDAGTTYRNDICLLESAGTTFKMINGGTFYTNTVPQTWVATDFLNIALTYEAA